MQYLMMIWDNEKAFAAQSKDELGKLMQDYGEFTQAIVKSGHFRAGGKLQPTTSATTVREANGKRAVKDGAFVESKEQIGGYYLVECKDLDEALAIAERIPSVRTGGAIEVRPLAPTSEAARTPSAR